MCQDKKPSCPHADTREKTEEPEPGYLLVIGRTCNDCGDLLPVKLPYPV